MSSLKLVIGASGVFISYLINSVFLEKMFTFNHVDSPINIHRTPAKIKQTITSNTQI